MPNFRYSPAWVAQPATHDTYDDVAQQAALVLHDFSGNPAGQSAQGDADDGGNDEIHVFVLLQNLAAYSTLN